MPNRHLHVVYKLDGNVSEIDVFKLAPTLLAIGELIQDGNRQLNPNGRQVGVNVKPFREGSFIVDLSIFSHSNLQQFLDVINSEAVQEIKNVLTTLGVIVGTNVGLLQIIRFLRGKPKTVEEVKPGEFRYTALDDRSITVNAPVHQLLSNSQITNNIYKVYASPLEEQESVTDVRTYIEGEKETEVRVSKDEVPAIREFVNPSPLPISAEETIKETTQNGVYLNPKRGSFDGDAKDWSFRRGEGIVVATIRDRDFLEKCIKGEYRLNYTDLLTVDLLERQRVVGTQVMKPTYEIVKVTSYVRGAQQAKLPLDE